MELDSEKIKTFKNFYQDLELGIYGDLNKALARYSKQGDNPDESVFYMEQFDNLNEELDLEDDYGPYINVKEEHDKILFKLYKDIETYGLKKLIIEVYKEEFFSYYGYYYKTTSKIKELDLVPRLLRLNAGYFDLYMVRDEDYKNLFKFAMFDYYYHYVNIFYYYNICSYLYPQRVPKISDNLFAELVEYSKEREKRLFKK